MSPCVFKKGTVLHTFPPCLPHHSRTSPITSKFVEPCCIHLMLRNTTNRRPTFSKPFDLWVKNFYSMKITVLWDMVQCNLADRYRRFRRTCLHHHGRKHCTTLSTKAVSSSATLVLICRTTLCHIPEDSTQIKVKQIQLLNSLSYEV